MKFSINLAIIYFLYIFSKSQKISAISDELKGHSGFFANQIISDNGEPQFDNTCFCKLNGEVDDCECKIESIDKFNNYKIYPRLKSLVQKDYFRYIKLNLKKECKFWPSNDGKCALKDCHVEICNEDDLPKDFVTYFENDNNNNAPEVQCDETNRLGNLNQTISDENLKSLEQMERFDDAKENFCEPDDEALESAEFTDLLANPERYTGYKGAHAHKIWNSIYNENCFEDSNSFSPYGPEIETCLEKRVFYRLISGLHTSINIHLSSKYLHKGHMNQPDHWGPNVKEFKRRFSPSTTNQQGPQWLKNLYFLYLVELRAISKAVPYFEKESFYAGTSIKSDHETKKAFLDFLNVAKRFNSQFDESILFKGNNHETLGLREQFQSKFRNITRIMDCVGCDKCKLWGKVQTRALGTALKILFSDKQLDVKLEKNSKTSFQLSRVEIVALINGFARISTSIAEIEEFRELLSEKNSNKKEPKLYKFDL